MGAEAAAVVEDKNEKDGETAETIESGIAGGPFCGSTIVDGRCSDGIGGSHCGKRRVCAAESQTTGGVEREEFAGLSW